MRNIENKLQFLFGLCVSGIFLYIVIHKMDLTKVVSVLSSLNFIYLIPITLSLVGFFMMFAYRWEHIFVNFKKKPKMSNIYKTVIIGYMGNNLMPARIGELIRIYILKKRENIETMKTLATLVLERVFDGLAIATFFVFVLFFSPIAKKHLYTFETISYSQLKFVGYILSLSFIVVMVLLFIFRNQIKFIIKLSNKIFSFAKIGITKRIQKWLFAFAKGLSVFRYFKDIVTIYFYSIIVWLYGALLVHFCLMACNIDLPISASFFVLAFIGVACLIPSSPGFIGTLEFFAILGLSCYGVDKDTALGFAVLYHAVELLPVTILGLYFYFKENFKIKDLGAVEV